MFFFFSQGCYHSRKCLISGINLHHNKDKLSVGANLIQMDPDTQPFLLRLHLPSLIDTRGKNNQSWRFSIMIYGSGSKKNGSGWHGH